MSFITLGHMLQNHWTQVNVPRLYTYVDRRQAVPYSNLKKWCQATFGHSDWVHDRVSFWFKNGKDADAFILRWS